MPVFQKILNWARALWTWLLSAGDISGKLITLVALPSAITAIIAFYEEIEDVLTPPDVRAEITSIGLRCGLALDTPQSIQAAQTNPQAVCNDAPMSAWIGLSLVNPDSIARTIVSAELRIVLPEPFASSGRALVWDDVRIVQHPIVNDIQSDWRMPWTAIRLEPAQELPLELDFRRFRLTEEAPFQGLFDAIRENPSPLLGQPLQFGLCGRFSGQDTCTMLVNCTAEVTQSVLDRALEKDVIRAITLHSGINC